MLMSVCCCGTRGQPGPAGAGAPRMPFGAPMGGGDPSGAGMAGPGSPMGGGWAAGPTGPRGASLAPAPGGGAPNGSPPQGYPPVNQGGWAPQFFAPPGPGGAGMWAGPVSKPKATWTVKPAALDALSVLCHPCLLPTCSLQTISAHTTDGGRSRLASQGGPTPMGFGQPSSQPLGQPLGQSWDQDAGVSDGAKSQGGSKYPQQQQQQQQQPPPQQQQQQQQYWMNPQQQSREDYGRH